MVNQTDDHGKEVLQLMSNPAIGEVNGMLWVDFNCTSGWPAVLAHISSCVQQAGYTESSSSVKETVSSLGLSQEMADAMGMYVSPGADYFVTIRDNAALNAETGLTPDASAGAYTLIVLESKQ